MEWFLPINWGKRYSFIPIFILFCFGEWKLGILLLETTKLKNGIVFPINWARSYPFTHQKEKKKNVIPLSPFISASLGDESNESFFVFGKQKQLKEKWNGSPPTAPPPPLVLYAYSFLFLFFFFFLFYIDKFNSYNGEERFELWILLEMPRDASWATKLLKYVYSFINI